jgi:hypothetical protein
MNSNKETTAKERIYGASIALILLGLLFFSVNKESTVFRIGTTFAVIFLPRLMVEFTYYPLRAASLTIFRRKRD